MSTCQFIERQRRYHPVRELCQVLGVASRPYCVWRQRRQRPQPGKLRGPAVAPAAAACPAALGACQRYQAAIDTPTLLVFFYGDEAARPLGGLERRRASGWRATG